MNRSLSCLLIAAVIAAKAPGLAAAGGMVELRLPDRTLEGAPLAWGRQEVRLLGRDGRLWSFATASVRGVATTAREFRPYSPSEFRAALLRELGDGYEVSGTGHDLVAHPRGQRDRWAGRFEDLYRSFVHYFAVRGCPPAAPRFPLVGIVRRNRAEFVREAGFSAAAGRVEGYYDLVSNRINIYDMGQSEGADWRRNASVLIHEATHQTAFNTGIHSRYAPPPLWLAEGLAMLFEAPGVFDSHAYPEASDRVNRVLGWATFGASLPLRHRPEVLRSIVASDAPFRANPGSAYAEAWAMSFFLVETEPAKYVQYLRRTASRPRFTKYSAQQRLDDFVAAFGGDWSMLDARLLRFIDAVE